MKRLTHMLRPAALLVGTAAFLLASIASANSRIPRDEGFMRRPASVQNRLYSLDGKSDLAAFFAFSIQNQLTEHLGGALVWDYSFTEYVALDVMVGGGNGGLTSLAKKVRETAAKSKGDGKDLEDAGGLMAHASIGIRFTSAYGKLSLLSEWPLHFHAYAVGGIGGALVNYNGVLACANNLEGVDDRKKTTCPNNAFRSETAVSPAVNLGVGVRFILNQRFTARVEIRDVIFLDRWYDEVNFATPGDNPGKAQSGFTHAPLVMLGVGVTL